MAFESVETVAGLSDVNPQDLLLRFFTLSHEKINAALARKQLPKVRVSHIGPGDHDADDRAITQ
jgi:hypothetical protein